MTANVKIQISAGPPGGYRYQAELRWPDGSKAIVWADDRARLLANCQRTITERREQLEVVDETLEMDEFGEIVREPTEWSVKA